MLISICRQNLCSLLMECLLVWMNEYSSKIYPAIPGMGVEPRRLRDREPHSCCCWPGAPSPSAWCGGQCCSGWGACWVQTIIWFPPVALAVGCALVWNVVLSARLSGGDWRGPPQSHPSLALLPSLLRVLFNPDLFGLSIVTWFLLLFLWYSPIRAVVKLLQSSPSEECPTG